LLQRRAKVRGLLAHMLGGQIRDPWWTARRSRPPS